uniref:Uncharacterized protein n=1 Tax=Cucumis melo TaxID=3656 RepID=A0A9I9EJ63_CUCME
MTVDHSPRLLPSPPLFISIRPPSGYPSSLQLKKKLTFS